MDGILAECWKEIVGLLLDGMVFGVFTCFHCAYKNMHAQIQDAKRHGINPEGIKSLADSKKSCAIIHGVVKPADKPIKSAHAPDTYGVVQKMSIKNHAMARNPTGFWTSEKHTIKEAHNFVPFFVEKGPYKVRVESPLDASYLDLDTIVDYFEPAPTSFFDSLMVLFTGVRHQGIQTTEEMLKVGTLLTGVGELSLDSDNQLSLGQPSDGTSPFILTVLPVSSLLKKLDEQSRLYWWLAAFTGSVGLVILYSVSRKAWKHYKRKEEERRNKELLEAGRKQRRQTVRGDNVVSEAERCVICQSNPREIFLLPCGHVCMCEDCSSRVEDFCPLCRTSIVQKYPAFIS